MGIEGLTQPPVAVPVELFHQRGCSEVVLGSATSSSHMHGVTADAGLGLNIY